MPDRSAALPVPRLFRHPDGITAVDTEYLHPGHAAAHIVQHGGRAAIVDVGTNDSVPYLLAGLEVLGIPRESVDYLLLTHVHLDHAGGAGLLMRELPRATAVLHPRGAPHLIDPAKLIVGARAVYGAERYRRLYGEIVPLAAERVRTTQVFVDRAHACIFSGDTFGLSYRELDSARGAFIVPTTTPTQFDPQQAIASVDRLLSYSPEAMYLMHFSRVTDVPRLAESLKAQILDLARIAEQSAAAADPAAAIRAGLSALWRELALRHGCPLTPEGVLAVLAGDLELNTLGLLAWLQRRHG